MLATDFPVTPRRGQPTTRGENLHDASALDALISLTMATQRLLATFHRILPEAEGSEMGLLSLTIIAQAGRRGISQIDLARAISRQPASITRLIDRLEAADLVSRSPHPCDRRIKVLLLTEKGQQTLDAAAERLLGARFATTAQILSELAASAARLRDRT